MSNDTPSTRYSPADPSPKSTDVFNALMLETAKSVPGVGVLVATIDRIYADHEVAMLREMFARLEGRLHEIESFVTGPLGASLTAKALRLASREMASGKAQHYVEALIALLPRGTASEPDFEAAARVLDDLSHLDQADLGLLSAFRHSPTIPVQQLVMKPIVNPMPDLVQLKRDLESILPTVMRLQGMGLLLLAPKPMMQGGAIYDVGEYRDFLESYLHLSSAGRALVFALGMASEQSWRRS